MKIRNKKIIITGGAGFIGSNLTYRLYIDNDVTVIDDLSSGRIENIQSLIDDKKITFVKGSITNYGLLEETLKDADLVFHQAAIVSVPQSFTNPVITNNVNINGTVNIFKAAKKNNLKKVIWSSSCAVYGDSTHLPLKEESKLKPLSPYANTKTTAEYYANIFKEIYNLPIVSLRYFNVYGPKQNANSQYAAVIPIFIKRLLEEKSLTIFGDGKQTRDFVFVDDVVRANVFMAENNASGVYNVGSGREISINNLALVLQEISGKKVKIDHEDEREGEVKFSFADVSKLKSLGFCIKSNLEDGLKKTFDWYKNIL